MFQLKKFFDNFKEEVKKNFLTSLKTETIKIAPYFLLGCLIGEFSNLIGLGVFTSILLGTPLLVVLSLFLRKFDIFK